MRKTIGALVLGLLLGGALGALAQGIPGAINLTAATITTSDIVAVGTLGPQSAQATLGVIAYGPNANHGTFVINGATPVTVSNTLVTANSSIIITLKTVGGTVSPNAPAILTITPGTGFTVGGTASDTSTYNYYIIG